MNTKQNSTYSDFLRLLRRSTDLLNEDPIREEIFSIERLEQYALYLAEELSLEKIDLSPNALSDLDFLKQQSALPF